jgi:anti-anti-sigma regulatory factor
MTSPAGHAGQAAATAGPPGHAAHCALGEELMIYQVAELWAQLDAHLRDMEGAGEAPALRVDCTALREFDGAGLQLLLITARHLDSMGACLSLVGLNDKLREQLSGLDPGGLFDFQAVEAV